MALKGDTSDLDRLQYGGVPILPERDSYKVTTPDGVVSSDVAGGLPKTQLQYLNQPYEVSVTYKSLDGFKAAYIQNFFTKHQGQAFIATLLLEGTALDEYVVKYLGSTDHNKTGYYGTMTVKLLVDPAVDACFMDVIQDWGNCAGSDTPYVWCYTDLGVRALP